MIKNNVVKILLLGIIQVFIYMPSSVGCSFPIPADINHGGKCITITNDFHVSPIVEAHGKCVESSSEDFHCKLLEDTLDAVSVKWSSTDGSCSGKVLSRQEFSKPYNRADAVSCSE